MPELVPKNIKAKDLTEKERSFANEYLKDLNARQAAIRAGYSEATAREACKWIQSENPQRPKLAAYIQMQMAKRSKRTGINADRVIQELAKIAFADINNIIDLDTGKIRPNAKKEDLAAVESVCVQRGENTRYDVRLHNKQKALELLGKHLGMFTDKMQISGAVPMIIDDSGDEPEDDEKPPIGFE